MAEHDRGGLSIVIASLVGPPFIDDCLASVESEARQFGAQVIVVACGPEPYAARIRARFPWVEVIHRAARETVPALRRCGVEGATGDLVAVIEEHCVAAPDWLHCAVAAHARGEYAAVGGPVGDDAYRRLRDWVVYFVEYNRFMPPWPEGESAFSGSANIAYRRQVLLEHLGLLDEGYWEATLHPTLLASGARMVSVPEMVVRHRGPSKDE